VLQASNLLITRRRVVHRVAGTVIGVGLAFGVLGWHPPIWLVVIAVALFQGLVELVIATHYGVAVAGITVLALLLFHVAAPGTEARSGRTRHPGARTPRGQSRPQSRSSRALRCRDRLRPEPAQAAGLRQHLDELASAIVGARAPGTAIPALPR
jgi:hypothetical protein